MAKSNSTGTKLKVNSKVVGSLKSIDGIDVSADAIDVTALDNTSGYKEKLPGIKDVGNVSCSGFLDGEDEGQSELYSLLASGEVVDCSIVFPTGIGKTWSFKAGVVKFKTGASVGDAISFDAELAVSGAPTLAATTTGG